MSDTCGSVHPVLCVGNPKVQLSMSTTTRVTNSAIHALSNYRNYTRPPNILSYNLLARSFVRNNQHYLSV